MELKMVEMRYKEESGKECTAELYTLGAYEVDHYVTKYADGVVWDRVQVSFIDWKEADANYTPEIMFYDGSRSWAGPRGFKIQTSAYGAKTPEEIQKVVAGYNYALEAVAILTDKFC